MPVNFGNYTSYLGNANIDNTMLYSKEYLDQFRYDPEHYNKLLNNREYEAAADYASKFRMNDPKAQRERENNIINLRNEGRIMSAIFSNIYSDDEKKAVEFSLNVFSDGGLEKLENNDWAKRFSEIKQNIGGKDATKLAITFAPEKRKLFGIDKLALDNSNNINNFYDELGLTAKDLRNAEINISEADGYTTLSFNKSNKYSNYILSKLSQAYSEKDTSFYSDIKNYGVKIQGLNDKGDKIDNYHDSWNIINLQRLLREANSITEKYTKPVNVDKVYSSTIGTFIEDGLEELRDDYNKGKINLTTFKALAEERYSDIISTIKSMSSTDLPIYSNVNNKADTDDTLEQLNNIDRSYALSEISSSNNFSLKSMIVNGKIGTLIEIDALPEDKKHLDIESTSKESIKTRRHIFFIPGLFHDKAQRAINSDTNTRASKELNDMQNWGYTYKLSDGSKLKHKGGYVYTLDNVEIGMNEAKKYLTKEFMIDNAKNILKYQFVDGDGKINKPAYSEMLKNYTIKCINELYPDISLTDMNYNSLNPNDIFNIKGIGSMVASEFRPYINMDVTAKLEEIYRLYDYLTDDMNKRR